MASCLVACHGTMHTGKAVDAGDRGGAGTGGAVPGGADASAGPSDGATIGIGGAGGSGPISFGGAGGVSGSLFGGAGGSGGSFLPGVGGMGGKALGGAGGNDPAGAGGGSLRNGGESGTTTAPGGAAGTVNTGGNGGKFSGGASGTNAGGAIGPTGGMTVVTGGTATGGTAAGGTVLVSSTEPVDTRPTSPRWTPPFSEPVGAPGWQQSTSPICDANQGVASIFDVWADERGVFAMVADECRTGPCPTSGPSGSASLKFNAGSGWQLFYQFAPGDSSYPHLWGGLSGGPLLVTGTLGQQIGAAWIDNGTLVFEKEFGYVTGGFAAGPLDQPQAYVIDQREVFVGAGGNWSSVGKTDSVLSSVWSDGSTVIAVGGGQTMLMGPREGPLASVTGVPAGDFTALWAFGPNDIWLGNTAAQLAHYDGSKWKIYSTGAQDNILNLWGASGTLYFSTASEFGRWNGSSVEILLSPPAGVDLSTYPAQFGRFWGRSATDVFIPLRDSRYASYACGGAFLLWYDGATFHPF